MPIRKSKPTEEEEFQEKVDTSLKKKRLVSQTMTKMKNLKQYRDMSDEEFADYYSKVVLQIEPDQLWEVRVQAMLDDYDNSYDLDDLKPNDFSGLMSLIHAQLRLDDNEKKLNDLSRKGLTDSTIILYRELSKINDELQKRISSLQDDLKITRKIRKNDKEESVITYLENLKKKANEFYKQKMMYVFCPKCNTLLATVWTLYPDYKGSRIELACHRDLGDNNYCDGKVSISTKELLELGGSNKKELLPESML